MRLLALFPPIPVIVPGAASGAIDPVDVRNDSCIAFARRLPTDRLRDSLLSRFIPSPQRRAQARSHGWRWP